MSVVQEFYQAFTRKDGDAMAHCYSSDIQFSDPVFPNLKGQDAKDMWRMLCQRSKDLQIEFEVLEDKADRAVVIWDAYYTFVKTGRKVHNHIRAELSLRNGKIWQHRDQFSFWRWSRQALGPSGLLLGFTPVVKNKVREEAAKTLAAWQKNSKKS